MRRGRWRIGERQGSCPPLKHEQSASDEDSLSTPTPPETPPILNDDLQPNVAIDPDATSSTNKASSNVFAHPLSCSIRRVRSWSKKRSAHQKDTSSKTRPTRPISAEAVAQPAGQPIKKSTSLVELKTLCRKLQRHFTTTGLFGVYCKMIYRFFGAIRLLNYYL